MKYASAPLEALSRDSYTLMMAREGGGMPFEPWDKLSDYMRRQWMKNVQAVLDTQGTPAPQGVLDIGGAA